MRTTLRTLPSTWWLLAGLLYAFPLLVGMVHDDAWHQRLERLSPASAGLAVQATKDLDQLPVGPWQGLVVLAGYAAGGLVLGGVLLKGRDV
ncbi:hypothetical protein [Streptomyces alboflavus]|uniref:hypothetical protein n=1 Tax=Streptomyces alboflavus TaxID=67267 RepID=UPI0004C15787|nr:hypothetical protein [Streptomyces alboflavus]